MFADITDVTTLLHTFYALLHELVMQVLSIEHAVLVLYVNSILAQH